MRENKGSQLLWEVGMASHPKTWTLSKREGFTFIFCDLLFLGTLSARQRSVSGQCTFCYDLKWPPLFKFTITIPNMKKRTKTKQCVTLCFKSSGWRFPFFFMFSKLTACSPISDCMIPQFSWPCWQATRMDCQRRALVATAVQIFLMILMTHQCVFFCKVATAVRIKGVVCLVPSHTFPQNTRPIWNHQSHQQLLIS